MARLYLSGLRLRYPLPSLLAIVCAERELVTTTSDRGGDPHISRGMRRAPSGPAPHLRTRGEPEEGRIRQCRYLAAATDRFRSRPCNAVPGAGTGRAPSAGDPGTARYRILPRVSGPFVAPEARYGESRQACGRVRHRSQRGAVRARALPRTRRVSCGSNGCLAGGLPKSDPASNPRTAGPYAMSLASTVVVRVLLEPLDARIRFRAVSQLMAAPERRARSHAKRQVPTMRYDICSRRRSHGLQAGAAVQ